MATQPQEYTPGPWQVEVDDQSGIGRTHAVYVCSAAGWPDGQLARVNVQDGLGEREANARLIAAAPDLLNALYGLLRVGEDADLGGVAISNIEIWRSCARAAIAKALGEVA